MAYARPMLGGGHSGVWNAGRGTLQARGPEWHTTMVGPPLQCLARLHSAQQPAERRQRAAVHALLWVSSKQTI